MSETGLVRNVVDVIGKRVKSVKDITIYRRFPGSEYSDTLPAGKPSPVITGYLKSGYFSVKGGEVENGYIKDGSHIQVVEENSEDESGLFSGLLAGAFDMVNNSATGIKKNSGFLADGFSDSIGGVKTDFFDLTKTIKPIIVLLIALVGLITFKNIIK